MRAPRSLQPVRAIDILISPNLFVLCNFADAGLLGGPLVRSRRARHLAGGLEPAHGRLRLLLYELTELPDGVAALSQDSTSNRSYSRSTISGRTARAFATARSLAVASSAANMVRTCSSPVAGRRSLTENAVLRGLLTVVSPSRGVGWVTSGYGVRRSTSPPSAADCRARLGRAVAR